MAWGGVGWRGFGLGSGSTSPTQCPSVPQRRAHRQAMIKLQTVRNLRITCTGVIGFGASGAGAWSVWGVRGRGRRAEIELTAWRPYYQCVTETGRGPARLPGEVSGEKGEGEVVRQRGAAGTRAVETTRPRLCVCVAGLWTRTVSVYREWRRVAQSGAAWRSGALPTPTQLCSMKLSV